MRRATYIPSAQSWRGGPITIWRLNAASCALALARRSSLRLRFCAGADHLLRQRRCLAERWRLVSRESTSHLMKTPSTNRSLSNRSGVRTTVTFGMSATSWSATDATRSLLGEMGRTSAPSAVVLVNLASRSGRSFARIAFARTASLNSVQCSFCGCRCWLGVTPLSSKATCFECWASPHR